MLFWFLPFSLKSYYMFCDCKITAFSAEILSYVGIFLYLCKA